MNSTNSFPDIHQIEPNVLDLVGDNLVPMTCANDFRLSFAFYAFVAATSCKIS